MSQRILVFACAALAFAVTWVTPTPSQACGGFFCSATAPVNQAAERIIFAKHDDGTVSAVIQIQYQGPSEDFAWMLPVPGVPDVSVSSDLAFQRLQTAGNPQYILTQETEGECRTDFGPEGCNFGDNDTAAGGGAGGSAGSGGGPPVTVLAEGTVGPFDFVVIQPNPALPNLGDVAVEWLTDEGYDVVPPGGDPMDISDLLGSYLNDGMNLLSFRLTKGNDAGSIRPIRIRYASELPMIPIRPTAVAANPDMGVLVWVLGDSRAVPANYKSLELNEALIDWTTAGSNYNAVVTEAANEAEGQGFVTEQASGSEFYDGVVLGETDEDFFTQLRTNAVPEDPRSTIFSATQRFGAWDGYRDIMAALLPPNVDVTQFLNCPQCVEGLIFAGTDVAAFLDDVEADVIDPMRETQALIDDFNYVSRLYTTMSAPEMDMDPVFDFNADLQDVDNLHNATQITECNPSIYRREAPTRVELEDGRVVRLDPGAPWPFAPNDGSGLPANARILEVGTSGEGTVVTDNTGMISAALEAHNDTVPRIAPAGLAGGAGCDAGYAITRSGTGWALVLMAILMWVVPRSFRSRT